MNQNLGIIDSEKQWILNNLDQIERDLAAAKGYQESILNNCIWAEKGAKISVANSAEQWGTPMHYTVLEKLVRKLPGGHNYVFFDFADLPQIQQRPFKSLYWVGGGERLLISPYGKTILPEWSTLESKKERIKDFNVRHLDRKDYPKPIGFDWKTGHQYPEGTVLPGWTEIEKCQGENADNPQSRGWRTIFARIVGNLLATPAQVEKVIGSFKAGGITSRQSWQNHMGRRNDKLGY